MDNSCSSPQQGKTWWNIFLAHTFLSRYVFTGAEVYPDSSDDEVEDEEEDDPDDSSDPPGRVEDKPEAQEQEDPKPKGEEA